MSEVEPVIVVTGASRGLGRGMADAFLKRGFKLGLLARSPIDVAGDDVLSARVDVGEAAQVARFADAVVARFGRIDLWINNAGVLAPIAPLRDVDPAEALAHWRANVAGVLHGSQAFVRHVRARPGSGVLINVSSGAARQAYAGWSVYCAGKAAVDRMTECLALEEAESGLRAHALAPGVIDTEMQALIRASSPEDFPEHARFVEMKRQGAFSTPEAVAELVLALAFDPAHASRPVCVDARDLAG